MYRTTYTTYNQSLYKNDPICIKHIFILTAYLTYILNPEAMFLSFDEILIKVVNLYKAMHSLYFPDLEKWSDKSQKNVMKSIIKAN
jgi:hypothetical protein